jgi:repressor LexA
MTAQTELGPLTQRQELVYRAIVEHYRRHRVAATVREIGQALGISSPNGVMHHVRSLKRKGWLVAAPNKARSIIPTLEALSHAEQ